MGIFIKQLLQGKSHTIFGDGTQTRDFVYIQDNINAALKAMDNPKCAGEAINIGTGKSITILELANILIKMMDNNIQPKFLGTNRIDIKHRCPNVSKMQSLLGFYPEYKLEQGLAKTIDWYR